MAVLLQPTRFGMLTEDRPSKKAKTDATFAYLNLTKGRDVLMGTPEQ
jgi:hypothetical protein